jgi:hypothetical protein
MRYHMLPKSKALRNQGESRNSRCGRHRHKDIRLTEGGLELYEIQIEQSAEVIVVDRKRAVINNRRTHELMKD